MTPFDKLLPEDRAALDDAARWWERLRAEPAQELSAEFLQWVSEPRNGKALNAVRETMAKLDVLGAAPRILDMRRSALKRLRKASAPSWPSRRLLARAAAILLLCAAGAGGYAWYRAANPVIYETGIGERKLIPLSDGSRIALDSDSAVGVRYTNSVRAITLDHGRARFDVAHDPSRPFTVAAGADTVVAVGTAFNVEKLGPKILVTLIQGRVVVKADAAGPIHLTAGQEMVAIGNRLPVLQRADLDAATAWESGHLIFRGESLGDAVQRMNRYTHNPITVSPAAASFPISGVFGAGDIGTFVNAVTAYFPVDATTDAQNRIRLEKRT